MTANQRLVVCLLIAHMTAVFVAAVPGLGDFGGEAFSPPPANQ